MESFLKDLILKKPKGLITYAEFIELALYHPQLGYYMKDTVKIGKDGDFYTTSNVSTIYGNVLGKWYAQNYMKLNIPAAICEIGGGNGRFAEAFLEGWQEISADSLTYIIIESSPYHQRLQREVLGRFEAVVQYKNIGELVEFNGLVFSNELFDALPVHVIERKNEELYEVMITYKDTKLSEVLVPLTSEPIKAFLGEQRLTLKEGQRIEIPLAMEDVLKTISGWLGKGMVITVDYGYTNEEWMVPSRRNGSLRGYYHHRLYHDILNFPGQMDITSHIHLDALIGIGRKHGLNFISLMKQDEFLMKIGILNELKENDSPNPFSEKSKKNRAIRNLILPGGISHAFHVIIQEKNLGNKGVRLFVI